MKVRLDVNLKIGTSKIMEKGSIFDDSVGPIPDYVMRRIARGQATIISHTARKEELVNVAPAKFPEPEEELKIEEVPKGKVVRKVIRKRKTG
jgi:hypothetical protein